MVRFARAKGSKASNEKLPENATPWRVMKDQLEEKQQIKKEIEESKEFSKKLDAKSEPFYPQVLNTNTDWAEFENAPVKKEKVEKKKFKPKQGKEFGKKNPKYNGEKNGNSVQKNSEQNGEAGNQKLNPGVLSVSAKRRLRRERLAWKKTGAKSEGSGEAKPESLGEAKPEGSGEAKPEGSGETNLESSGESQNENPKPAEKKMKLEQKVEDTVTETPAENGNPPAQKLSQSAKRRLKKKRKLEEQQLSGEAETKEEKTGTFLSKRQKRNLKKRSENAATESNEPELKTISEPEANNFEANGQEADFRNGPPKKVPRHNHLTPAKIRDDNDHPRRKPDHGGMKIILHGEEVEVVKFGGFPMRKEDAVRLKELRQEMVMKGVPKPDIEKAMKMERRKAEKNLSRIKKQVCFLCRKSGHNLSDCPNLDKEQAATGICFKCGSTEHTHFECRTNKTDDYKFASCFICRERGHIAKQCPDNPKGVYPDGGCCNVCGDVTHLKKDCPELIQKKEEATLTVETISNDLECLDEDLKRKIKSEEKTKPKLVKF